MNTNIFVVVGRKSFCRATLEQIVATGDSTSSFHFRVLWEDFRLYSTSRHCSSPLTTPIALIKTRVGWRHKSLLGLLLKLMFAAWFYQNELMRMLRIHRRMLTFEFRSFAYAARASSPRESFSRMLEYFHLMSEILTNWRWIFERRIVILRTLTT